MLLVELNSLRPVKTSPGTCVHPQFFLSQLCMFSQYLLAILQNSRSTDLWYSRASPSLPIAPHHHSSSAAYTGASSLCAKDPAFLLGQWADERRALFAKISYIFLWSCRPEAHRWSSQIPWRLSRFGCRWLERSQQGPELVPSPF